MRYGRVAGAKPPVAIDETVEAHCQEGGAPGLGSQREREQVALARIDDLRRVAGGVADTRGAGRNQDDAVIGAAATDVEHGGMARAVRQLEDERISASADVDMQPARVRRHDHDVVSGAGRDATQSAADAQMIRRRGGLKRLDGSHGERPRRVWRCRRDDVAARLRHERHAGSELRQIQDVAGSVRGLAGQLHRERAVDREGRGCQGDAIAAIAPAQLFDRVDARAHGADGKREPHAHVGAGGDRRDADDGLRRGDEDERVGTVAGGGHARLAAVTNRDGRRPDADVVTRPTIKLVRDGRVARADEAIVAAAGHQRGVARRGRHKLAGRRAEQRFEAGHERRTSRQAGGGVVPGMMQNAGDQGRRVDGRQRRCRRGVGDVGPRFSGDGRGMTRELRPQGLGCRTISNDVVATRGRRADACCEGVIPRRVGARQRQLAVGALEAEHGAVR